MLVGICTHLGCLPNYMPNPIRAIRLRIGQVAISVLATDRNTTWRGGSIAACRRHTTCRCRRIAFVNDKTLRIGENPPGADVHARVRGADVGCRGFPEEHGGAERAVGIQERIARNASRLRASPCRDTLRSATSSALVSSVSKCPAGAFGFLLQPLHQCARDATAAGIGMHQQLLHFGAMRLVRCAAEFQHDGTDEGAVGPRREQNARAGGDIGDDPLPEAARAVSGASGGR